MEKKQTFSNFCRTIVNAMPAYTKMILLFIIIILIVPILLFFLGPSTSEIETNFWYGFMSYFGTVSLAAVAFWQNAKLNKSNELIQQMSMRSQQGRFMPREIKIKKMN